MRIGGIDVRSTVSTVAFLPGDPTIRLEPGRLERATVTPDGVGAIVVTWSDADDEARVETHGDGAAWLLERAPALLGCDDDPQGFEPAEPPLRDLWRRHRRDRIPRTGTLWHDLAWLVVQQRITTEDASVQWRRLVRALGSPVPGVPGLVAPPPPALLARLPYHDLHRYGIERQRADTLRRTAQVALRVQARVDEDSAAVMPALRSVRGIGRWTASWLQAQTWGEPDAVVVGDHGIPAMIAWLLARERTADDARLLELLEPHRPHRQRVIRLAFASGARPPRRHPRGHRNDIRRR